LHQITAVLKWRSEARNKTKAESEARMFICPSSGFNLGDPPSHASQRQQQKPSSPRDQVREPGFELWRAQRRHKEQLSRDRDDGAVITPKVTSER